MLIQAECSLIDFYFLLRNRPIEAALKNHIVHTFLFFDRIENSEKAIVMERIKKQKEKKIIFNPVELKQGVDNGHYRKDFIQKEIQIILILYNLN